MTINNAEAYVRSLWDWSFLDDCFVDNGKKTGIKVSDFDGFGSAHDDHIEQKQGHVHRNGHWILIEAKPDGYIIDPNDGQYKSHRDLVRVGFTVVHLFGEANRPRAMQAWYESRPKPSEIMRPASLTDIHDFVSRWFVFANTHLAPINWIMPPRAPIPQKPKIQYSDDDRRSWSDNDPRWLTVT
jgi:hypothetical protein